MQDLEKWFGRWDATHLLHDASQDSSVNEAFLQRQCIMTWDKCGGSRFTKYPTHNELGDDKFHDDYLLK